MTTDKKPTEFIVMDDLIIEPLSEERTRELIHWIRTVVAPRISFDQKRVDVHDEPKPDGGAEHVDPVPDVDPENV